MTSLRSQFHRGVAFIQKTFGLFQIDPPNFHGPIATTQTPLEHIIVALETPSVHSCNYPLSAITFRSLPQIPEGTVACDRSCEVCDSVIFRRNALLFIFVSSLHHIAASFFSNTTTEWQQTHRQQTTHVSSFNYQMSCWSK
eukprot:m.136135 g.136135  ORF g.136135 m.136135 type:complete len:141 (-) comp13991_c0_seq3:3376-3798(-)